MTFNCTSQRGLWSAFVVVSGLCLAQPVVAQEASPTWGSLTVQSKASSSERVAYFKNNLTPHAPSAYNDPEYHKTIVKLNWYDDSVAQSRIVNLKRTFDIYGLFEGTSITLTEQAKAILDDLGTAITSEGIDSRMYAVAGHSVVAGDKKSDQTLSTQRANVVRAYLMEKFDIAETRLVPVGFGSHNLKDKGLPTKTENNRIEICMIEDLYEKETTTSVQLPDVNSKKPLEIKVVSLDTKTKPKPAQVNDEAVDDSVDEAELELASEESTNDVAYVSKPKLRKRFSKRFRKQYLHKPRFQKQERRVSHRYKRRYRMTRVNAGWGTVPTKVRSYRTLRPRYKTRRIRRYDNPYCPPW